ERAAFEPAAPARGDGQSPPPRAQNRTVARTTKSSRASPASAPAKRDPLSPESAQHFQAIRRKPGARGNAPGLCRLPDLLFRSRLNQGPFERVLEGRPAERLHHVIDRLEAGRLLTRRFDTDAEDRQPQE